jgi:hypothetical protein
MCFFRAPLIACFLLVAGLLVGCDHQPPRMKNQPPDLDPGNGGYQTPSGKVLPGAK